ncbi:DUF4142 domain-containing protein [Hymenobacter caeli]|uniref:Membrane protein n=1 Tax=Hymenobacter caeli TaxID=2735894 RepID=A0ABX2FQY3_9BACT|nr:DUF4142 domain-containing protein [Hymenobacter caeli]NRT18909.1 putative membrane protein [Hymenobacter caeli]
MPFTTVSLRARLPLLALAGLLASACSSGPGNTDDPVAAAQAQNEHKIDDAGITKKQQADADFLVKTASNGLLEQELAKLAQAKAATVAVRAFGPPLLQSRLDLLAALRTLAGAKQLAVPAALGKDEQAAYHDASQLTGLELDKKLLATTIRALKQDRDAFQRMEKEAYDGDIRAFAAKYGAPAGQQLDAAQAAEDVLNK